MTKITAGFICSRCREPGEKVYKRSICTKCRRDDENVAYTKRKTAVKVRRAPTLDPIIGVLLSQKQWGDL
ncbi:MAG: hypothetical protein ABUJ92_00245 [Desulfobacterales bacterium]